MLGDFHIVGLVKRRGVACSILLCNNEKRLETKIESRRVTLECQTRKVRRNFVTHIEVFRHIRIRQPVGFVTKSTCSKSPNDIAPAQGYPAMPVAPRRALPISSAISRARRGRPWT